MDIIVAPSPIDRITVPSLFLAGGITGCPDWQAEFIGKYTSNLMPPDIAFINPRRSAWDSTIDDTEVSKEQIRWEKKALDKADGIIFWFPEETLCPITLFELGMSLLTRPIIAIGIHPNYARRLDVEVQVGLVLPKMPIVYTTDDLAYQAVDYYKYLKTPPYMEK